MAEDVRSFFRAVFLARCRLLLGSVGAAQGPVCPRLFFFFFHACQKWDECGGLAGRDVGWDVPAVGWGGGWEDGRRFFFGRGSLFFPCPPGGGLGGEPQARSSSFAFFFLGFCVARGGPRPPSAGGRRSSTPPRRVFSPSFFFFFPLAWQDRARVELAVKARSSSLGRRPFFSPVRTRSSTPRRPVPP